MVGPPAWCFKNRVGEINDVNGFNVVWAQFSDFPQ